MAYLDVAADINVAVGIALDASGDVFTNSA